MNKSVNMGAFDFEDTKAVVNKSSDVHNVILVGATACVDTKGQNYIQMTFTLVDKKRDFKFALYAGYAKAYYREALNSWTDREFDENAKISEIINKLITSKAVMRMERRYEDVATSHGIDKKFVQRLQFKK